MPTIPRRAPAVFALAIVGGLAASCSSMHPTSGVTDATIVSDSAIARVNAFRAANGSPPLAVNSHASQAALHQAEKMAAHQEMEHNIGFGANFASRMKRNDVPLPAAENIATGQQSIDAAITAWENSPPHRRNMLDKNYDGVGVAVAKSTVTGRPYWSMVLTGG